MRSVPRTHTGVANRGEAPSRAFNPCRRPNALGAYAIDGRRYPCRSKTLAVEMIEIGATAIARHAARTTPRCASYQRPMTLREPVLRTDARRASNRPAGLAGALFAAEPGMMGPNGGRRRCGGFWRAFEPLRPCDDQTAMKYAPLSNRRRSMRRLTLFRVQ
jgi:hypothetical protein